MSSIAENSPTVNLGDRFDDFGPPTGPTPSSTQPPGTVSGPQHGRFRCYSMMDLSKMDLSIDYIFRGALVANTPGVIGAREKSLKSSIGLDAAISMATGKPWLNFFASVRVARAVYFVGEGGLVFARDAAARIAKSKGLDYKNIGGLYLCPEVPNLDNAKEVGEATVVLRDCKADFAFFDPLYLMMAEQAQKASNVYAMGAMLQNILRACRDAEATPILVHHFTKSKPVGVMPDLADLSQSGCAEFAGQWALLNRQKPYDDERPGEHDLIARFGSRMTQTTTWSLHVSEGTIASPDGRCWDPRLSSPAEARKEAEAAKELARQQREAKKLVEAAEKIRSAMERLGGVHTKNRIKEEAGNPRGFVPAFADLLQQGHFYTDEVRVSNHKKPSVGYGLAV